MVESFLSQEPRAETPLLLELAEAVKLREGPSGTARALWLLHAQRVHSTHAWSKALSIPIPVLAALRRELEKRGILASESKLKLTEPGRQLLAALFGDATLPHIDCPACQGLGHILPPEACPLLDEFIPLGAGRPAVDVTLDQSHATPDTSIRKALILLEAGWLHLPIFILGDDDLISIACLLARRRFLSHSPACGPILVADVDTRYLDYIRSVSENQVSTAVYDARQPLPAEWAGQFAVALTDPAYTPNAIAAFAARCHAALGPSGVLLLSMPLPDSATLGPLQQRLTAMGWAIRAIHPQFNRYEGASIHAHVSHLFVCEKWRPSLPEEELDVQDAPFYTAQVRDPSRFYRCIGCGKFYRVGPGEEIPTIQELKRSGCRECRGTQFEQAEPGGVKTAASLWTSASI